jgi:peptidoglycan LD-endopeptidase LytH
MRSYRLPALVLGILLVIAGIAFLLGSRSGPGPDLIDLADSTGLVEPIAADLTSCPGAPFVLPTSGWIGVLFGHSILGTRDHSGLDIFGRQGNGVTPVYAAFDGFATRLPDWTSAVIIRHPEDPLLPGRQIWTYYAHMADAAGNSYIVDRFRPGTVELPVRQGELLGYQGDYNGGSPRRISTHLHFSIVKDDGSGQFLNETEVTNTLDPSPYLGMRLNARCGDTPPVCRADVACP